MFEILFNVVMISVLLITMVFCWKLNKKIEQIKGSRKALLHAVAQLDSALLSAQSGIDQLQKLSDDSAGSLQSYIKKAEDLSADLKFLVKDAHDLADRLEGGIRDMAAPRSTGDSFAHEGSESDDHFDAGNRAEMYSKHEMNAGMDRIKNMRVASKGALKEE